MARYIDAERLNLYDNLFMTEDAINKSGVYVRYRAVENLIKNAPTEDVAPVKHAKLKNWQCTNCNMELPPKNVEIRGEIAWQYAGEMNYCPNCGAKMEEEK